MNELNVLLIFVGGFAAVFGWLLGKPLRDLPSRVYETIRGES